MNAAARTRPSAGTRAQTRESIANPAGRTGRTQWLVAALVALFACAPEPAARFGALQISNGNLFLIDADGRRQPLDQGGRNKAVALALDGRTAAIVRGCVLPAQWDGIADQLWLIDLSLREQRVLGRWHCPSEGDVAPDGAVLRSPQFSNDGSRVFVLVDGITPPDVHSIEITPGAVGDYLSRGDAFRVIRAGPRAGQLLVRRDDLDGVEPPVYFAISADGRQEEELSPTQLSELPEQSELLLEPILYRESN